MGGTTNITVAADQNQGDARSTQITISGGIARTVSVSQSGAVITYDYTFTVSPTSLSFAATGETKSVQITSTRQKYINGVASGSPEAVTYQRANSGAGIGGSGASISYSANTGSSPRSGTVTYTQDSSGKQAVVNVSQAAKAINKISVSQSDEEIDETESKYTCSAWAEYPVASKLTVTMLIKLGRGSGVTKTFTIQAGAQESESWDDYDDPAASFVVQITDLTPTEDSSYTYEIDNY